MPQPQYQQGTAPDWQQESGIELKFGTPAQAEGSPVRYNQTKRQQEFPSTKTFDANFKNLSGSGTDSLPIREIYNNESPQTLADKNLSPDQTPPNELQTYSDNENKRTYSDSVNYNGEASGSIKSRKSENLTRTEESKTDEDIMDYDTLKENFDRACKIFFFQSK